MSSIEQNSVTFADLGLSETVLAAVADMGYEEPTPVQAAASRRASAAAVAATPRRAAAPPCS